MTEVYFLRDHDAVKVGVATNFRARLNQLQTGNSRPLDLVGTYDVEAEGISSFAFEKQMHRLMKPYHIWREWFKITNEDLEVIRLYALSLCKRPHFKTAPCIVRSRNSATARVGGLREVTLPSTGIDTVFSDTRSVSGTLSESATGSSPVVASTSTKRPVGRPKTITDMKAYKREKAREYRAKLKLERENAK